MDIHAARFVEIDGCFNFRDLGGLPTSDGGHLRRGLLFRSDALHLLQPSGVERLHELGIVTVIDLRSEHEVARWGSGPIADESFDWIHAPLSNVGAPGYQQSEALASGELATHYLETLDERTEMLTRALAYLANGDRYPAVFHCTVGKDRTGVLAALLLGVVGVSDEVIVEDYALTDERMPRMLARLLDGDAAPSDIRALGPSPVRAEARSMEGFLRGLQDRHGGAVGWARSAGVPDDQIVQLRKLLVESPGGAPRESG